MKVQLFVLLFLFSFSIRSVFGQEYIFEYKDFFDLMEQIDRLHPPCTPKLRYKKYINRCIEKRTHIRKRQISEYTELLNRIKRGEYIASQPTSCVGWTWKAPMNPYKPPYLFLSLVRVSPSAFSCRTSFLYYSKYVNPNQLFLIDCTKEEIPEQFVNFPGGDS